MVNTRMFVFKHPKYYKELRERNKSDQVISNAAATAASERAPDQGHKLQAASHKLQAPSFSSSKPQASSPEQQASSFKPQAASSMILEPRKSFTVPGPRASTIINVLCGCFTWKAIWCGENLILFPLQTFNSTVKKCPELLYPNRSGVPSKLLFSSLIHEISLIFFLTFAYNLASGFKGI